MNDKDESFDEGEGADGRIRQTTDVIREALAKMEIHSEETEEVFRTRILGEHVELDVLVVVNGDDLVTVVVRFPVRATEEFRAKTGEFLHRLNFTARRKLWEIDYDDGEIRAAIYVDTLFGSLGGEIFQSMFHFAVTSSDVIFPYLTSVLSGRLTPEFASDQAEAAMSARWEQSCEEE